MRHPGLDPADKVGPQLGPEHVGIEKAESAGTRLQQTFEPGAPEIDQAPRVNDRIEPREGGMRAGVAGPRVGKPLTGKSQKKIGTGVGRSAVRIDAVDHDVEDDPERGTAALLRDGRRHLISFAAVTEYRVSAIQISRQKAVSGFSGGEDRRCANVVKAHLTTPLAQ